MDMDDVTDLLISPESSVRDVDRSKSLYALELLLRRESTLSLEPLSRIVPMLLYDDSREPLEEKEAGRLLPPSLEEEEEEEE